MIARILSDDPDLKMPPADSNKSLTAEEIAAFKLWIKQGADWQEHWAYQVPVKEDLPAVKKTDWSSQPIDRFILARLEKEGLTPTKAADRITLIRRVSHDLTGLPPSIKDVNNFLNDKSPNAYEKVVDRLLASPRYAQNMSRYWLDAARYGDTHGLHLDNYREMWPYRDWVVKSFNNNMPYDQFVIEQLAGDLLKDPTDDQLIATGFIRCHVTTSEGGSIAEEVYVRNVVDRVVTFGTVFLGATFDCTRCHDHKFDPYTMNDFYSLFAYFNSMDGNPLDGNKKDPAPILQVPSADQKKQLANYDLKLVELNQSLAATFPRLNEDQKQWEAKATENAKQSTSANESWTVLVPEEFHSQGKATLTLQKDQSLLANGTNPTKEVYEVKSTIAGDGWLTIRLEGLIDPSLTNAGAGRSPNSNVVLTEFEAFVASADTPENWQPIKFRTAQADFEQPDGDFKIINAIDGKPGTGWAIGGHLKKENRIASFVAEKPFGFASGTHLKIVLKHESQFSQHQFGRFRLSVNKKNPIKSLTPANILAIFKKEAKDRDKKETDLLRKHYREKVTTDPQYLAFNKEQTALKKTRDDFNSKIPITLIFKEKKELKKSFILNRGEYDQHLDEVTRRTPLNLPAMNKDWSNDRLGLAKWLTSEENPLMARVTVNRFWQQIYGTGIIKTAADLGSQGEAPTHSALLDWLAVEFRESNWDVKHLFKLMVLSATYKQSSKLTPDLYEKDPENRLYARGPRFRLDAEPIRDQALFVSGLLNEKQGGPSVKPPQPDGLWSAVGYSGSNTVKFTADTGSEKVHRRSLYTFLKRTAPSPQMSTFDAPSRESSCVRRERTNTPMQALLLFNDPQYLECAQGLAARAMKEKGTSPESIVSHMFQLCTSRTPNSVELQFLVKGYQEDLQRFNAAPEEAASLIKVGSPEVANGLPVNELAAWTITANILLCADEVITKN
ncbi:MAG: DUF1553 domain-containing protein [Planctomycetaceae bacterium]|nr:DUF1553 domain-containing protein [Planctomycetaceae bacterium]